MNKALMVIVAVLFTALVAKGQIGHVQTVGLNFNSRSVNIFGENISTLSVAPALRVELLKNVSTELQLGTVASLAATRVAGKSFYEGLSFRYETLVSGSWKVYGDIGAYAMFAKISDKAANFQQEIISKYSSEFYSEIKANAGTRISTGGIDLGIGTSLELDGMVFSIEKSILKAKDFSLGIKWHF